MFETLVLTEYFHSILKETEFKPLYKLWYKRCLMLYTKLLFVSEFLFLNL